MLGSPVLQEKSSRADTSNGTSQGWRRMMQRRSEWISAMSNLVATSLPHSSRPVWRSGAWNAISSSSICLQTPYPTLPSSHSPTRAKKQVWMEPLWMRSRCQAAFLPTSLQKSSFWSGCSGAEWWGPGETWPRPVLAFALSSSSFVKPH